MAVFNDVSQNHWAYGPIQRAYYYGLVKGNTNGSFLPDEKITRAESTVISVRVFERNAIITFVGIGVIFGTLLYLTR